MVARAALRVEGALIALVAACAGSRPLGRAAEVTATPDRTVAVAITRHGFEPAEIPAHAGETLQLVFTRRVAHTCVTRVVLWLTADRPIERELPLDVPVSITLALVEPGDVGFACPMHMYGGRIEVRR